MSVHGALRRWTLLAFGLGLAGSAFALTDTAGTSFIPIYAYDAVDRSLFGAAGYWYDPRLKGYSYGGYLTSNLHNAFYLNTQDEQRGWGSWDVSLNVTLSKAYQYYYGEGKQTPLYNPLQIFSNQVIAQALALYRVDPAFFTGPYVDLRGHEGTGLAATVGTLPPGTVQPFPNELSPAVGWLVKWEGRDNLLNSTRGYYLTLDGQTLPGSFGPGFAKQESWQADADGRLFTPLPGSLVWAQHLSLGFSQGDPTFMYRYYLGGTTLLRGYEDDRFRGKNYYCVQEELRVPVWRMFAVALSTDLGNITDGGLDLPKVTYQAGLRIGLPPDWGMKARIDFGYAPAGDTSFAFQFGQTF